MFQKVSAVVLVFGMLVQVFNLRELYLYEGLVETGRLLTSGFQGLMFLVYPLLGHVADVCLNRYRIIKWSFTPLICGQATIALSLLGFIVFCGFSEHIVFLRYPPPWLLIIPVLGVLLSIVGTGMSEANIIQFGLDQLLESPTHRLIAFIHWYYVSLTAGKLLTYYVYAGYSILKFYFHSVPKFLLDYLLPILLAATALVVKDGIALFLWLLSKKHFYIQSAGLNPFQNIYKVLKYSWKHTVPEHRSALTYWEEDIPRRIDLGKNKYGGPFTNEEVEDTKTFFRILPLLLCLFGYHIAGDGYSTPIQLQRTSCPSLPVLLLIVINPLHISALVTMVGIPLYRLVIKRIIPHYKGILILTRMWIGLFLCIVQITVNINIVLYHDASYWHLHHTAIYNGSVHQASFFSPVENCLKIRMRTSDPVDNTYLWLIIPQLLNGLSSLFVSTTVLEFICAQAPRTTQGLLIGLWYATYSIRYLVVGILDTVIVKRRSWLICEGVKGFLILVSLVLFSCVSKQYRYRQRDEVVNVQAMIEDTHERWLDQEEEYERNRKAYFRSDYHM